MKTVQILQRHAWLVKLFILCVSAQWKTVSVKGAIEDTSQIFIEFPSKKAELIITIQYNDL